MKIKCRLVNNEYIFSNNENGNTARLKKISDGFMCVLNDPVGKLVMFFPGHYNFYNFAAKIERFLSKQLLIN